MGYFVQNMLTVDRDQPKEKCLVHLHLQLAIHIIHYHIIIGHIQKRDASYSRFKEFLIIRTSSRIFFVYFFLDISILSSRDIYGHFQ